MKNTNHRIDHEKLIKNISDAVFAKDKQRRYIFVNEAAAKMIGKPKNQIMGKTAEQVFNKSAAEKIKKVDSLNLKGRKVNKIEQLKINNQTHYLHTIQNPIKDKGGKVIGITGVVRDLSEVELNKQTLERAKEEAERYLDIAGVMLIALDAQGKVSMINKKGCEILGYKKEEIVGKDWFNNFLPKGHIKEIRAVFKKIISNGLKLTEFYENPIKRKDGSKRIIAWHNSILKNEKGKTIGILSSGEDITEQKNVEIKLKESEEKFRLLYETSSDAVMTLEPPTWNFTSGNSAIIQMFGVKDEEEFTSLPPWKLSPKYQPDGQLSSIKAKKMIMTAMKKGEHFFEWTHKKLNDGEFYATVLLNRVDTDAKSFLQARVTDITPKKVAEQKLLKSKERFKDIAKSTGDFIWEVNKQGEYTYTSGKVKSILGYSPKELIGTTPFDLMSDEEAVRVGKIFAKIAKTKKPLIDLENWNIAKDGKQICLLTNATPILNDKKELVGYRGVDKDITKEKLEELQNIEEVKNYELISKIGIALNASRSFDDTITDVLKMIGEAFNIDRIVGFKLEKNLNIALNNFSWQRSPKDCMKNSKLDLDSIPSFVKILNKEGIVLADDIKDLPSDLYIFFKSKNIKSILSVAIKPLKKTDGFICFHAIDEYKQWDKKEIITLKIIVSMLTQAIKRQIAREDLINERDKLHKTLYNIGDAVIAVDRDLQVVNFNKVASRITGIDEKDILGKRYDSKLKFVHSENKEKVDEFILDVFATGQEQRMRDKTVLINSEGKEIPIADSAAPLKDAEGNVIGCVLVFRDITIEQEINKLKTEFVSVASHQLRTPLGGIKWFAELLLKGKMGKLNTKQKKAIKNIESSNERMILLVKDLLNVSRMEEGKKLIIKKKQTNICEIIKIAIEDNTVLANEHKVNIALPESCQKNKSILLNIDSERMSQVVKNVINNAIKYSKCNTEIKIDIKKSAKETTLIFKDQGVGIPQAEQHKIFDKFFRAYNIQTMQTDGTGLGLYICKVIVEAHGGKIWLKSKINKGTTVFITIPKKAKKKK